MSPRLEGQKLVIASHSAGKVHEISDLLLPYDVTVVSARDLELPVPEEIGETFAANATIKARAAADATGLPALADDSGLAVAALDGQPGVHSARWAGSGRVYRLAMEKVERELAAVAEKTGQMDRRAAFVCVLCLVWPDKTWDCFEGRVEGLLVSPPRGVNGFGYDSLFMPDGFDITFGEMDTRQKQAISHRAVAFAKFAEQVLVPES